MLIPGKRKRIAAYSVVIILVLIFGIIFPLYHVYDPFFKNNPEITVQDGHLNVTYSGDFKTMTENLSFFTFSTDISRALVMNAGHHNSTLGVNLTKGNIIYDSAENQAVITFNLSVGGHFSGNLYPESLTVSISETDPNSTLSTFAPPSSTAVPRADNLSPNTLGYLWLSGADHKSVTTNLLNQIGNSPFYNFYVSVQMQVNLAWHPVSAYTLVLSAQVNGLSEPVNSALSMTIVEES